MSHDAETPVDRKAKVPTARRTPERGPESRPNAVLARSGGPATPEQRLAMIAEAAYYMAERRGFEPGHEVEDWLFAESQINAAIDCGELLAAPR